MNLYRVVVSFMREQLQFMAERGVIAMTPGQALNDVLDNLQVDLSKVQSFKTWTARPDSLDDFTEDAKFFNCINTKYTVRDYWSKRFDG